jgi:hypothetical protein
MLNCHKVKYLRENNHLGGDPVVKVWDQEVCFLCGLRFEPSVVSGSSLMVAHMMANGGLHGR